MKRYIKYLALFALPLLLSCGATVAVDYDKDTDFSGYNTYNYYPNVESGLSQLDDRRVQNTLDSLMTLKGFSKNDQPQILINYYAKESIVNSRNTIGVGVGSGGRNGGIGVGGGIPIGGKKVEQEFTIDFVDNLIDKLVWQTVANGNYPEKASPSKKERYYQQLLTKILEKYPPKK